MTQGAGSRKYRVVVCRGPECGERRGSAALHASFERELRLVGLAGDVELGWQSCFGRCRQGPNVLVRLAPRPEERSFLAMMPVGPGQHAYLYNGVTASDVPKIVESHLRRGIIVRELVLRPEASLSSRGDTK